MKQTTYLISAFILGLSIVISAFIFSNTCSNSASKGNNSQTITNSIPDLMTRTELSEYLQISEQSIENIIQKDDLEKAKLSSYDTYHFIPYLKIDNQERFLKAEIDKWLQYKSENR
ncbi:helix-turn-helix domain-containing protein (plasmid) [Peribacillus sp. JNUCC 23]